MNTGVTAKAINDPWGYLEFDGNLQHLLVKAYRLEE